MNLPVPRDPLRRSAVADERLRRWLAAVMATPGLTAIRDPGEAHRVLLEDALRGVELVGRFAGPIVDVGSGGGTPGIPLAVALPDREVTLLEAERRKAEFLRSWTAELPNLRVIHGRAEEQPIEQWGVAVAKALAPPPVAAEWCLPLVVVGGAAILWVGPSARAGDVSHAAQILGGGRAEEHDGLFVLPKRVHTPPGFPRRPGVARKRPLR